MPQKTKTMTCPKCGHEQEERLDCKKCGVVFSKFYALHSQQGATGPLTDNTDAMDRSELSRLIKDLSRRFNEFEFERAERNRLRGDLRILDQKVESALKEFGSQMAALQVPNSASFAPGVDTERETARLDQTLAPLHSRLQHLETQLDTLAVELREQANPESQRAMEARIASLDGRISDLQAQSAPAGVADPRLNFDSISKELAGMQSSLQNITARLASLDGRISNLQTHSVDFDNIAKELAGMQTSLQNVTVRYSEIGELKKNHLVLSNTADTILRDMGVLKEEASKVQTSLQHVTVRYSEIGDLKKNDLVLSNSVDSIVRDLALLKEEASTGASSKIAELQKEVTALRAEVRQMLKDRQDLPPLEVDVHTIRENLEDIRRFMSSLTQKL